MNVLVVAPHPDDEAIGCGGTILKHVAEGDHVEVVFVTSGEGGVSNEHASMMRGYFGNQFTDQLGDNFKRTIRETEAGWASQVLGTLGELHRLQVPDGGCDSAREFITEAILQFQGFDRMYLPSFNDAHADHIAVASACQRLSNVPAGAIWYYEVWTPLAEPNEVVDITAYASGKRGAINCYKSQLGNGFAEAILGLNRYRGELLGPHFMYAEAFYRA